MYKISDDPRDLEEQRKLMGIVPLKRTTFLSSGALNVLRPSGAFVKKDEYSALVNEEVKTGATRRTPGMASQLALAGHNAPERGAFSASRPVPIPSYKADLHDGITEEALRAQSLKKLPQLFEADGPIGWGISSVRDRRAREMDYAWAETKKSVKLKLQKEFPHYSIDQITAILKTHVRELGKDAKKLKSRYVELIGAAQRAKESCGDARGASLMEQKRLAGINHTLPGINEANFRNAKILDKRHVGNEVHYEIMDPAAGVVKAQSVGTKIDIQGHMERRAHARVWSTIMRDLWGPSWNMLPKAVRGSVNAMLEKAGFDGNGRFVSVGDALGKLQGVLEAQKIQVGDTLNAHSFHGPKGQRSMDIEFKNNDDPFSPIPIRNSMVSFSWYAHAPNGPYEVVAYLS